MSNSQSLTFFLTNKTIKEFLDDVPVEIHPEFIGAAISFVKAKRDGSISDKIVDDSLGEEAANEIEAVNTLVSLLEDIYGEDQDDQDDDNGDGDAAQEDMETFKETNQLIGEVFTNFTHDLETCSDGRNHDALAIAPEDQLRDLSWTICANDKEKSGIGTLVINYK